MSRGWDQTVLMSAWIPSQWRAGKADRPCCASQTEPDIRRRVFAGPDRQSRNKQWYSEAGAFLGENETEGSRPVICPHSWLDLATTPRLEVQIHSFSCLLSQCWQRRRLVPQLKHMPLLSLQAATLSIQAEQPEIGVWSEPGSISCGRAATSSSS